ncbi:protein adenylyltransferase SelO [Undibacterium sp. TC4M20W]|uniref:protein adenylyltransferase SelO n=1 Tax=Undibacterium sp. TC4M20W TaxID=3413052 RepID=UPI003BF1C7E9
MNTPPLSPQDLMLENKFAELPRYFYTQLSASPIDKPYLVAASDEVAAQLNLDQVSLNSPEFLNYFSGNQVLPGSKPLAAVYSGHQFGVWAGQLGDGRALLLGGISHAGQHLEIQLKGAGMTPYSRMGDGRAVLRSSIREFLCSEAMAALNIPTSRALCVIGSDQMVFRETPETSAVVARVAPSFVRFGSFEHWYYNDRMDDLRQLADYVIQHSYPELQTENNPYQSLLATVTTRTAELMAQWQAVGFMHGVMNTDNMSIIGQTLDYGPFGFMEAYDEKHICNHTDQQGRYSYRMQPAIGNWNCQALAQALSPLIGSVDDTNAALSHYPAVYRQKWSELMHQKFGLKTDHEADLDLFAGFFTLLQSNHADFTLSFRHLSKLSNQKSTNDELLRDLFLDRDSLDTWLLNYRARLAMEQSDEQTRQTSMQSVNPKYILRNYLAQQAIEKAQQKDFSEVRKLLSILENPYDEQEEHDDYASLPPDWAKHLEVSCSS